MHAIKVHPGLGQGLLWHAMNSTWLPSFLMYVVVVIESTAALLMLLSGYLLVKASYGGKRCLARALTLSNVALMVFFSIWLWFFCGDLWFGFWLSKGAFAAVHATWIMTSLLMFIFVNDQPVVSDV